MRLPTKRGFTAGTIHTAGQPQWRYYVELWEQPLHRYMAAQIYHRYDTLLYRVPGFAWLERTLHRRHRNDDFFYIPLGPRKDIRCYELGQMQRTTLARLDVEPEAYVKITGRPL